MFIFKKGNIAFLTASIPIKTTEMKLSQDKPPNLLRTIPAVLLFLHNIEA